MIEYEAGRFEMKYAVPVSLRGDILAALKGYVTPDPHATLLGAPLEGTGARGYTVHSLYFDTPRLDDYFDRLANRQVRDRLRVRTYGEPGDAAPVFMENKRKYETLVVKQRAKLCTYGEYRRTAGDTPWRAFIPKLKAKHRFAAEHISWLIEQGGRVPVSSVHYVREVFVPTQGDDAEARLTMDHDCTATERPDVHDITCAPGYPIIPRGWMVLELKFRDIRPGWMDRLARELHLHAESVSKFGLSVAQGVRASRPAELRALTPVSVLGARAAPRLGTLAELPEAAR